VQLHCLFIVENNLMSATMMQCAVIEQWHYIFKKQICIPQRTRMLSINVVIPNLMVAWSRAVSELETVVISLGYDN